MVISGHHYLVFYVQVYCEEVHMYVGSLYTAHVYLNVCE